MLEPDLMPLEGRHARLEPLRPDHAGPLLRAATEDPAAFRWTSVPATAPAMQRYVEEALALRERGDGLAFATVSRASGEVVGSTRFANVERWPPAGPSAPPDAVEIGWTWLAPRAQRTAINSEAKLLMLELAFERWKVKRVTLKTDARNAQSRAAIERLGAKLDGVLRAHMPAAGGGLRDSAFYSILSGEWPALRARLEARLDGR